MIQRLVTWFRQQFYRFFPSELIRRVVKNTGYLSGASVFALALSFLQGIFAVRLVGVEGFGTVKIVMQFATMVNAITSFRMGELVVKYVGQFSERGETDKAAAVFKGAALVEMATSFISIGLMFPFAYWFISPDGLQLFMADIDHPQKTTWVLVYGCVLIFLNMAIESTTGLLHIFGRFRRIAVINVVQSLIVVLVTGTALIVGGDVFTLILAYLGSKLVGAVGIGYTALRQARTTWGPGWWRAPLGTLRGHRRELTVFGFSTNISGTLSFIVQNSDSLWISGLGRSTVEAGYFGLAKTLANLVLMPIAPLPRATYPELSRQVARRNWAGLRKVLRQGSRLAGLYTVAASVGLAVFGRWIITTVYDPEFLPAYPALMIILGGLLVANIFYWARPVLLALGLADYATKVNFGVTILNVVGALILIPQIGYLGSAILVTVSYVFGISLSVWRGRREMRLQAAGPIAEEGAPL